LNHFVGFLYHFCPVMMTTLSSSNKPYTLNYICATSFWLICAKNLQQNNQVIDITNV